MSPFQQGAQRMLIQRLVDAHVDLVLIGGLAVAAHGYERATRDVDVVFSAEIQSCKRFSEVLTELGAEVAFADHPLGGEGLNAAWLSRGGHFRFATEAGPLDALTEVAGLDFRELLGSSIEVGLGGSTLRVCSYEHLVAMKRSGGRPRDLEDLRELEQIRD